MEVRKIGKMTIEKHREETYYVNICNVCGNEFRVTKDSTEEICYDCQTEKAMQRAREALSFLIGAKITYIEPEEMGSCTSPKEIERIEVKTNDGKRIIFKIGGYDEHYMTYVEKGEEKK